MRSSKNQASSSRKATSYKDRALKLGSKPAWWQSDEDSPGNEDGLLVLHDLPTASQSVGDRHPWDLEERVAVFGEGIVRFSRKISRDPTNNRLIDQLVGAGTSTGANYCEANECVTKKDFRNTLTRCLKEAKETRFFLRMIVASESQLADEARPLYREACELSRIFNSMRQK